MFGKKEPCLMEFCKADAALVGSDGLLANGFYDFLQGSKGTQAKDFPAFLRGAFPAIRSDLKLTLDTRGFLTKYGRAFDTRWYDATYTMALSQGEQLIALLGCETAPGRLSIVQLQGQKGQRETLQQLPWRDVMLGYLEQWAEERDVPMLEILGVHNNRWAIDTYTNLRNNGIYPEELTFEDAMGLSARADEKYLKRGLELGAQHRMDPRFSVHLTPRQGRVNYDDVAKTHGYVETGTRNWQKIISSSSSQRF